MFLHNEPDPHPRITQIHHAYFNPIPTPDTTTLSQPWLLQRLQKNQLHHPKPRTSDVKEYKMRIGDEYMRNKMPMIYERENLEGEREKMRKNMR